jgi:4-oxalocrotonate tautomerase
MPHVNITWLSGRTVEQKRRIAERITELLVVEANARREAVHVSFVDVPATDYASAGVLIADRPKSP